MYEGNYYDLKLAGVFTDQNFVWFQTLNKYWKELNRVTEFV